jgi:hypothetical protein
MFAFTGSLINRNLMKEKFQTVETGELYNHVKYCCIRMVQYYARREIHLNRIIMEYRKLASNEGAIQLIALDGLPYVIPENKHLGNPIEVKMRQDRMTKPDGYYTWTNTR